MKERQLAALQRYVRWRMQNPPDLRMENGWLKDRNDWLQVQVSALSDTVEAAALEQERLEQLKQLLWITQRELRLEQSDAAALRDRARESPLTLQPAPAQQQAPEHQQDTTSRTPAGQCETRQDGTPGGGVARRRASGGSPRRQRPAEGSQEEERDRLG